ncbi:hypothetical protein [Streptomyces sp. TR02-1]|uniref:hypothetical protein n=1 Tax=Streptomyces sp. TR02-1 TaxID=3385977 RepID=UPI0039A07DB6
MKRFHDLEAHPPRGGLVIHYTDDSGREPHLEALDGPAQIWRAINVARALWRDREAARVRSLYLSRTEPAIRQLFDPVRKGTDTLPYCPSCGDGNPCSRPDSHASQVMEQVLDVLAAP